MSFELYFEEQLDHHPSMQIADAVKLCYQAAFGAEHLLADPDAARKYLEAEFASVEVSDEPIVEYISPDVCRVNLGAWKREGMSVDVLFEAFRSSAFVKEGSEELFSRYLAAAERVMIERLPDFCVEEWHNFLEEYRACGSPAIHHSAEYREKEKPAYRIVKISQIKENL